MAPAAGSLEATVKTAERLTFHQHPAVGAAAISSSMAGKYAAPASTVSPSQSATSEPQSGVPRTNDLVPSLGSMIQQRRAPARSAPHSSTPIPVHRDLPPTHS